MSDGTHRLDFSLHGTPERWFHAADESGNAAIAPMVRPRRHPIPVTGRRTDPFVSLLAGLAMALVAGFAWYLLELDGAVSSPWVVAVTGLLIGGAVRLGGGPFDPAVRGTISLLLFLVTTLVVSFLVVRHQLAQMDPDLPLAFEERMFLRNRILEPGYALATAGGAWLAIQANYLWARRR
jgi:hypothetical protein